MDMSNKAAATNQGSNMPQKWKDLKGNPTNDDS